MQTVVDVFAQLISVYYSSELVRVAGLSIEGFEVPPRALVHRYADAEHSFVIIDVNRKGRVTCTAITTAPYASFTSPHFLVWCAYASVSCMCCCLQRCDPSLR